MVIVTQEAQGRKVVFGMFSNYGEAFEAAMDFQHEALGEFHFHHVPQGEQQRHEMPILQQAA